VNELGTPYLGRSSEDAAGRHECDNAEQRDQRRRPYGQRREASPSSTRA
jgi:hypothetical protein